MFLHKERAHLWSWVVYYCLGLIVRLTGLMSLVRAHWSNNTIKGLTTGLFNLPLLAVLILSRHLFKCLERWEFRLAHVLEGMAAGLVIYAGALMLHLSFCMDWVLAVIAGNYSGKPDGDIAIIYWIYFTAKRLPLLQF